MKRQLQYSQNPKKMKTKKSKRKGVAKLPRMGRYGTFPPEKKYLDTTLTFPTYTSATAQALTDISNIATGDTLSDRTGDRAVLKSASLNVTITCAATTTGSAVYRVIMIYGKSPGSLFTGAQGTTQFQNITYTSENVVLYDKMKTIDATSNRAIYFRGNKKLNHLFQSTAGWGVQIIIKSTGTLATAAPTTTGVGRIRFTDD